ncbi:MAG: hypothetical protein ACI8V7_000339 [Candidatus Paceibacteria bacterium]|jgi:hypothetical protein
MMMQKNKGITLIELVISISIFTLILGAYGAFQNDIFSFNSIIYSGLKSQNEAKRIIKPLANEVRSASISNLGSYPLETVATTTFVFYSDIDNDSLKERVKYFLDGEHFKKGVTKPTGSPLEYDLDNEDIVNVVENVVDGVIFEYYDETYNGTATSTPLTQPVTPFEVRLVRIKLVIDEDPLNPPAAVTVETQVSFRNLKDNL